MSTRRSTWLILATALMVLSALIVPLAGGAAATEDNALNLNVALDSGGVHPTGSKYEMTATITSAGGCPDAAGCSIDFDIESGPESASDTSTNPVLFCTIAQTQSSCSVSFSASEAGTSVIRAWMDDDNQNSSFDADKTEGRNESKIPGERPEPDDTDVVDVSWAVPGVVTKTTASPQTAVRKVGTNYTITCKLTDGLGDPVASKNCDAIVKSGPHSDVDLDNNELTKKGYIGQCNTGPQGQCALSYVGLQRGTDAIKTWADLDGNNIPAGEPDDGIAVQWRTDIESGPCAGLNFGQSAPNPGGGRIFAGSPGDDSKTGTAGPDVFCGLKGADRFNGAGGNDRVLGGLGNDNLLGAAGNDNVQGYFGNDRMSGGDGKDSVQGQAGIDLAQGNAGDDTLSGGKGPDSLKGGFGRDSLKGDAGNDALDGGGGNDSCNGGPGTDTLKSC